MGQFVEQQPSQILFSQVQDRVGHRIGQPSQGRIGFNATYTDIVTLLSHLLSESKRRLPAEITAIGDAARDRKTPGNRFCRKDRRRKYIPEHIGLLDINETGVTCVIR